MIRVRFHGRGGHGVKTASRILGSAAFESEFQVQDCPVYGAERRGAPVAAFTRIAREPILERGVIERPDLIIISDETLIGDPVAAALAGYEGASCVFVNTENPSRVKDELGDAVPVFTYDISGRSLEILGRTSALSAGLGAAAARLVDDIKEETLLESTRSELSQLSMAPDVIEKNLQLASEVFGAFGPVEIRQADESFPAVEIAKIDYHDPTFSAPTITQPGNSDLKQTGNWRTQRPEIDRELCSRCDLCFVRCPDGAIALDDEGYPVIDYDHCKGCLICEQVCPIRAVWFHEEALS